MEVIVKNTQRAINMSYQLIISERLNPFFPFDNVDIYRDVQGKKSLLSTLV